MTPENEKPKWAKVFEEWEQKFFFSRTVDSSTFDEPLIKKAFQAGFEAGLASALQWRSMDSAPRDGTEFLAWAQYWGTDYQPVPMKWFKHNAVEAFRTLDGEAVDCVAWMPLPPPPIEIGE